MCYVPVDDGWEEVLGRMPNTELHRPGGNRTWAPPDRMWTLYH